MAQLTFTYDNGYVSEPFEGTVTLQLVFAEEKKHVIFIESRLGENMPWALAKSLAVGPMSFVKIRETAEGQQYRIKSAAEPTLAETSPITSGGSGSGGSQPAPNSVGSEEIKDESVTMDDLSPEVREGLDELNNISITDEDLEGIFNGNQEGNQEGTQEGNQEAGFDAGADEPDPDDI